MNPIGIEFDPLELVETEEDYGIDTTVDGFESKITTEDGEIKWCGLDLSLWADQKDPGPSLRLSNWYNHCRIQSLPRLYG